MKIFSLLVLLYLLLDLANPEVPGAFEFDPDESVEIVRIERDVTPAPPTLVSMAAREWLMVPTSPLSTLTVQLPSGPAPSITMPLRIPQRRAPDPPSPEEG